MVRRREILMGFFDELEGRPAPKANFWDTLPLWVKIPAGIIILALLLTFLAFSEGGARG